MSIKNKIEQDLLELVKFRESLEVNKTSNINYVDEIKKEIINEKLNKKTSLNKSFNYFLIGIIALIISIVLFANELLLFTIFSLVLILILYFCKLLFKNRSLFQDMYLYSATKEMKNKKPPKSINSKIDFEQFYVKKVIEIFNKFKNHEIIYLDVEAFIIDSDKYHRNSLDVYPILLRSEKIELNKTTLEVKMYKQEYFNHNKISYEKAEELICDLAKILTELEMNKSINKIKIDSIFKT